MSNVIIKQILTARAKFIRTHSAEPNTVLLGTDQLELLEAASPILAERVRTTGSAEFQGMSIMPVQAADRLAVVSL